jgi:hypothetical protein
MKISPAKKGMIRSAAQPYEGWFRLYQRPRGMSRKKPPVRAGYVKITFRSRSACAGNTVDDLFLINEFYKTLKYRYK